MNENIYCCTSVTDTNVMVEERLGFRQTNEEDNVHNRKPRACAFHASSNKREDNSNIIC